MSLDPNEVLDYLRAHPEFFVDHPELVTELKLPVTENHTVSLVTYQLQRLRDQMAALARENDHMIETARINSLLFERTRALVLALLDARHLEDLAVALDEKLAQGFGIPVVRVLLSDQFEIPTGLPIICAVPQHSFSETGIFNRAMSQRTPWIGRLSKSQRQALFESEAAQVASSAAIGLIRGHTYGLLALGHPDPAHFQSTQDTLFLDHIGEALAMILPRLIEVTADAAG